MFTTGNQIFATDWDAFFAAYPGTRVTEVGTGRRLTIAELEGMPVVEPLLTVAEVQAWFGACRLARDVETAARDYSACSPKPRAEHAAALAMVRDGLVIAPIEGGAVLALVGGTEDRMPELCDLRRGSRCELLIFDAAHPAGRQILSPEAQAAIN
ncbi:hypothetical protein [Methylobacterium sp. Leaf85]|uniref:hypothetical protein n=1 Tax=Methylobacterium sp. Leaf85 TaxID=1736241 RepID=UPI0006F5FDB2|nr:hypothetical protein [Methylobacterium sp. Leaf85]KQO45251.1 hypothetical protein ASF08_23505 [Methylobacterium sp. Leaf85]